MGKSDGAGVIASFRDFGRGCAGAAGLLAAVLCCGLTPAAANQVETVRFADPRWAPVRVVRGSVALKAPVATPAVPIPTFRATAAKTEIVTFGDGRSDRVTVVRGATSMPARVAALGPLAMAAGTLRTGGRIETVRSGVLGTPVNIVRGGTATLAREGIGLFDAATDGELDRVAFAVDGAESGHGANLAMWRPDLDGPQGPMQVSAAAALDVGGGNRFDLRENRLLGRAFLAKLYQRYGNWPDAVAAYNWGPGNVDNWIAAGRPFDRLPLETARYLVRVLRDALLTHM